MTIDRENRDLLIGAIDRYLNGETTAFKFDDEIFKICDSSKDKTLRETVRTLWFFYDDCKDHKVNLGREQWKFFQRLRLLLASNCDIHEEKLRIWSTTQILALVSLAFFFIVSFKLGFGQQTIAIAMPFGAVAMILGFWRDRVSKSHERDENIHMTPFSSFTELMKVRRSVPNFHRQQYPGEITPPKVHSRVAEFGMKLKWNVILLIAGPIMLFAQLWPITVTNRSVIRE